MESSSVAEEGTMLQDPHRGNVTIAGLGTCAGGRECVIEKDFAAAAGALFSVVPAAVAVAADPEVNLTLVLDLLFIAVRRGLNNIFAAVATAVGAPRPPAPAAGA